MFSFFIFMSKMKKEVILGYPQEFLQDFMALVNGSVLFELAKQGVVFVRIFLRASGAQE